MIIGITIAAVIVLVAVVWIGIYNSLVKARNWVEGSFSQIDVQLQRRNDLIPNIVETVKGYMTHERQTLESVTQARQQLVNLPANAGPEEVNARSNELTNALTRLLAVAEQYPDLKANTNFIQLQNTLGEIEENLSNARRYYNALVRDNNTAIEAFPSNLIANQFNFEKFDFFEIENDAERQNVEVKF